jgi:membrane protein
MTPADRTDNTETAAPGGRVKALLNWLTGRANTQVGRLALQWFRAYFKASHNSGCAATVYSTLSVLPAVLVAIAIFHPSTDNTNLFAERLIDHQRLTGSTASLVRDTFGSASSNALAASIGVLFSFLLWGIGIGQIYQDVYARSWGIKVGSVTDQGLFAIFFFVYAGAIALLVASSTWLHDAGLLVLVPVWFVASTAFWLWVPHFLLHRKIGLRALLPGALLAGLVLGGAIAFSPLFLASPLNQNGKTYGSFGVVITFIGYVFVMITLSMVCAVFSPVWASWRESERQLRDTGATDGAEDVPLVS